MISIPQVDGESLGMMYHTYSISHKYAIDTSEISHDYSIYPINAIFMMHLWDIPIYNI